MNIGIIHIMMSRVHLMFDKTFLGMISFLIGFIVFLMIFGWFIEPYMFGSRCAKVYEKTSSEFELCVKRVQEGGPVHSENIDKW